MRRNDFLVTLETLGDGLRRHGARRTHNDDSLYGLKALPHTRYQSNEAGVHEQQTVTGVVDDIDDLIREQARIDGVADETRTRDSVINLQMPMVIPTERSNAVSALQTPGGKCIGELATAFVDLGIACSM